MSEFIFAKLLDENERDLAVLYRRTSTVTGTKQEWFHITQIRKENEIKCDDQYRDLSSCLYWSAQGRYKSCPLYPVGTRETNPYYKEVMEWAEKKAKVLRVRDGRNVVEGGKPAYTGRQWGKTQVASTPSTVYIPATNNKPKVNVVEGDSPNVPRVIFQPLDTETYYKGYGSTLDDARDDVIKKLRNAGVSDMVMGRCTEFSAAGEVVASHVCHAR